MSDSAESTKGKTFEDVPPAQLVDTEVGTIENADNELLQSIGYRQVRPLSRWKLGGQGSDFVVQEFRREFTRWSTLSYAISIMGVLGSVPATYSTPLAADGPTTAVWA